MMGTIWYLLLLAAVMSGILGVNGLEHDDDRDKLSDKEIKEKLEILTNEVIQLKKQVQEIRGRETKGEETDKAADLKILSVGRKSLSDGKVLYTVRYRDTEDNHFMTPVWRIYENNTYTIIPETVSNVIPSFPLGVRETHTTVTPHEWTHLMVLVGSSNHWLTLFLNNESDNDEMETDIETPILDIAPKGDIVYDPGHNATFNISIPPKNDREGPGGGIISNQNFNARHILAKPGNITLTSNFDPDDEIFHKERENNYFDKIEMTVNIKTANTSYSGTLELTSGLVRKNGLIKRIENNREIVLRPSTQKGPFPEGMIYKGLVTSYHDTEKNENGDILSQCTYGETCSEYCHFFGNDLSMIELFKTVNGETTSEDMKKFDHPKVSHQKAGMFEVSPVEGDPSPVNYTCKAGNVAGQVMSYNLIVEFGYDVKILKNETNIENFNNGTARIVCTARGRPLPKMTMQCDYYDVMSDILYQTDDVISVVGMCRNFEKWSSFSCSAENDFRSDDYYYYNSTD